jgi:hypothetical protein
MIVDTDRVGEILQSLATLDKSTLPTTESGSLDVAKFNEMPEVIAVHDQLRAEGISSNGELSGHGFVAGAMVLRFK